MRRFLWDSLQEARNGALRNTGLTGALSQTEAPAPQFGNSLSARLPDGLLRSFPLALMVDERMRWEKAT